jgi:hypothetical protein
MSEYGRAGSPAHLYGGGLVNLAAMTEAAQLEAGIELHLIAFARYPESVSFVRDMQDYVRELRPEARVHRSEVTSLAGLKEELRRPAELILVSGHGPAFRRRESFDPAIGDCKGLRLRICEFGCDSSQKIGARVGIVFDACNAGRPQFREALAPYLKYEVTHVGVIGLIEREDSRPMVKPILHALFAPESPLLSPEGVAAAAEMAKSHTHCQLTHVTRGPREPRE